ncbi:hypothetical protein HMPREF9141_0345 [Prevotella multiformis DSM 16608]|uniref:Uncharacterized protein n=1 Tax=Prevotella multiformis DSM 16608 TaxID=888743 RepID=F0F429_9BACT|nr:hypothetical protein HMPREF9141_0345 [Prevotella multiformis DSM 16608]
MSITSFIPNGKNIRLLPHVPLLEKKGRADDRIRLTPGHKFMG